MTDLASIADEWWHKSQPVAFQGGAMPDYEDMKWGSFTKQAQSHGYSKDELEKFADYVLSHKDKFEPTTEKRANFYKNVILDGGAVPVQMAQPDYYKEHRNIVKLLEDTGKSLLNEAKDQKNEATAMAKKLNAPNPFFHLRGGEFNLDHLDMLSRASQALYGDLTPEKVVSGAVDAVQDLFKSPEEREKEKRQKAEEERIQKEKEEREAGKWSSYITPFFHLSGGSTDKYLSMAKKFARNAGYKDWDSLMYADDGAHKLVLADQKFGNDDYGDFIKYILEDGLEEALKHRQRYLARATKIRGDWAKDMYSPNSLAINILWDGKGSYPMSGGNIFDTISSIRFGPLDTDLLAQGLRQANPNASKIYDGLKGMFGGAKTEAELDAMKVKDLIEYGKSVGVKGLDGKTKKYIMDKIIAHEKTMPEVVAPKKDEGGLTPLKLYKMLLMEGSLQNDIIPLAKKKKIERVLHKNKKTLVDELYEKLLDNEDIQATDSIENVPKVVMYLFGKGPDPYADEDEDEEEEDEDEEEDQEEIEVTKYVYDTNPYLVENARAGLRFRDRRVFDPVTDEEEGTLGDMPEIAKLVEEEEGVGIEEKVLAEEAGLSEADYKELLERTYNQLKDMSLKELQEHAVEFNIPYQKYDKYKSKEGLTREVAIEYLNKGIRDTIGEKKGSGRKPTLAPQDVLEGKKDNPVVEETIEEPMDDSDIRQYLPNAKIMRYSGLARLSDIEQLLPTDKSYVVLLYENTPGSGHWVALMRYGRTIEFFCSYGSKIDAPLRWQNPRDNAMLGQTAPFLSQLLNKAKRKFRAIHNPVAYQSKRDGVATCGAWDVMRINQMKNHNQDLQDFHQFMESVKKETGLTYDEIVVNYVSKR